MVKMLQPYLLKVKDGEHEYLDKVYDILKRMVIVRYPNLNPDLIDGTVHRSVIAIWKNLHRIRFESPKQVTMYVNRVIHVQFAETYREFQRPVLSKIGVKRADLYRYDLGAVHRDYDTTNPVTLVKKPLHAIIDVIVRGAKNPERLRTILTHWANGATYDEISVALGREPNPVSHQIILRALRKVRGATYSPEQLDDLEFALASWDESL